MKPRNILWGLCAFSWACGDISPSQPNSVTESRGQATQAHIEPDAAPRQNRVWIDETHYTYPENPPENPFKTINGVRLRYTGMAVFADSAEAPGTYWVRSDAPSQVGDLMNTSLVDEEGRAWEPVQVNAQQVSQRVAENDVLVDQTVGLEAPEDVGDDPGEDDVDPGEWVRYTPATWNYDTCANSSVIDTWIWDSDDRREAFTPMSIRQRKVLILTTPRGVCSGTMVSDNWMLTSAHCVTTASGVRLDPQDFRACTYGNYQSGSQCFVGRMLLTPRNYSGDLDFRHDYALVKLAGKPGVGWMAISQARRGKIKRSMGYNMGYPIHVSGCSYNGTTGLDSRAWAFLGYWSTGDVKRINNDQIKTRIDASGGHSGGPFYYYPSGCCGSHYLTGVYGGHFSYTSGYYNVGPLGKSIRDWVAVFAN